MTGMHAWNARIVDTARASAAVIEVCMVDFVNLVGLVMDSTLLYYTFRIQRIS